MLSPAAPTAPTKHMDFPAFVDWLFSGGSRSDRTYALDNGVDETALIRYANGAASAYERSEIQNIISRCRWAQQFVVDYVKQKRVKKDAA